MCIRTCRRRVPARSGRPHSSNRNARRDGSGLAASLCLPPPRSPATPRMREATQRRDRRTVTTGRMPVETAESEADPASTPEGDPVPDNGLRTSGMRDLGPDEMRRFRRVERAFLETAEARGYLEVRTPTIEPLHLYTAAGTLSPQLLDRVYSFLDWDGWSGERVVLRPDATVAVARWLTEHGLEGPQRLAYVQPVYRFVPGDGDREQWQCGVELFGVPAPEGDSELLLLARDLLAALGLEGLRCELAHAGLARVIFAAAGLDAVEQLEAYDRMLEGDAGIVDRLVEARPESASALRLLSDVDGNAAGYLANLRAALLPDLPAAEAPLADLEAVARTLDAAGLPYRVLPGTARNFEYYSGVTFRMFAGAEECLAGGRYDGLTETIGGTSAPASGFGADLLRLARLVPAGGAR
ncbi:MAG: ATP phosphoribosyltransferase regulatory subunit [Dehalococcoidia bacterium]|nr:ATP phosphoribosyltransferase regulatory subunit [Dehalococcoidia bacterium]